MGKIKLIVSRETQVGKKVYNEIFQTFISDKYKREIIIDRQTFNL